MKFSSSCLLAGFISDGMVGEDQLGTWRWWSICRLRSRHIILADGYVRTASNFDSIHVQMIDETGRTLLLPMSLRWLVQDKWVQHWHYGFAAKKIKN